MAKASPHDISAKEFAALTTDEQVDFLVEVAEVNGGFSEDGIFALPETYVPIFVRRAKQSALAAGIDPDAHLDAILVLAGDEDAPVRRKAILAEAAKAAAEAKPVEAAPEVKAEAPAVEPKQEVAA